jgi:hypothetical protein
MSRIYALPFFGQRHKSCSSCLSCYYSCYFSSLIFLLDHAIIAVMNTTIRSSFLPLSKAEEGMVSPIPLSFLFFFLLC